MKTRANVCSSLIVASLLATTLLATSLPNPVLAQTDSIDTEQIDLPPDDKDLQLPIGLTEEEKTRIFEPFFSKKATGTGLGLYVTHSIVERHGGYIYVNSQYGAGTEFTVYLPVTQVQHGDTNEVSHPVSG